MFVVSLIGIVLGFFVLYQFVFTILSLLTFKRRTQDSISQDFTRFAILIPAHNEEMLLGNLIKSIYASDYPRSSYEVFVIADNCTDDTATITKDMGAVCLERFDQEKRGKPYALNWALQLISMEDKDAITIIDADTEIDPRYLANMNARLRQGADAVQGYFGVLNPDDNWLTRLSVLPPALRYKLQCPGKALLGLSCPLAGNGMVFSKKIVEQYGWNAFSIAENWEYYAILTLGGYTVQHESGAVIYSQVAGSLKDGKAQRTRWLKGRVDTIRRYWRKLLGQAIRKGRFVCVDTLIELIRPSHSILFLTCVAYAIAVLAGSLYLPVPAGLIVFSLALVGILTATFLCALVIERAPLRTWLSLGMVPMYLVWKLLVTLGGILSIKNREWIRTKRH